MPSLAELNVRAGAGSSVEAESAGVVAAGAQAERRIISRRRRRKRGFMDSPTVLKIQGAG
jgi:hypothetical protein